ncbi:MAG: DNA-3-methyladenine glycosylase I [Candidatus Omnitrophota bacterium]
MKYTNDHDIAVLDIIREVVNSVALPKLLNMKTDDAHSYTDSEWFREIAKLRSYSAVQASLVSAMIKSGALERAFAGFDINKISELEEEEILTRHWNDIKVIWLRRKVGEILQAGKAIAIISHEFCSFNDYIWKWNFPKRVEDLDSIERFWSAFDALQNDLKRRSVPIIRNEITLLHFLETCMSIDCLKPDVVVMRVAMNTGIVSPNDKKRERLVVKKVQEYCIYRDIRPVMVDNYLLAFGGQTDAQSLVKRSFCTKLANCASDDCPVGIRGNCPTGNRTTCRMRA